jgi:trehalose 6-phosphate synthase/phosphatase
MPRGNSPAASTAPVAPATAEPRLLIVSNRLPLSARWRAGRLQTVKSSGGLATGLDQVRQQESNLWIGWPGIASDGTTEGWAELERRFLQEALAPVPLSKDDIADYYDGFSNGVIWPLFHHLLDRMPIDGGNWTAYERVNERFATAIAKFWRPGDRIWIHDYHLMLLPALVRRALPRARIGFFLHIPFPSIDVFRALPRRVELLKGLLGADIVAFHTSDYVQHFLTANRQLLGVEPTADHVWWDGRAVEISALPLGIDDRRFAALSDRPDVRDRAAAIRRDARGRKILLGIDRLDYTKGIPRRLVAFQRLLEGDPSLSDRVRFIQVAVPSRIDARVYKSFRRELDELIGRINGAFGTVDSVPIHYLYRSIPPRELSALYCAADVMLVTPLRDGMNLVAKEFVASRTDGDGVLILSEFAGAVNELTDALVVNPYDVDGVAAAMARALLMEEGERRSRMRALRHRVGQSSGGHWARDFLRRLGHGESAPDAGPTDPSQVAHITLADERLAADGPLTLLLDYDGTLVPFAPSPEQAAPDPDLLDLLAALAAHPQIDIHLVTGRSVDTVQRWFWHLQAGLWAEHGAAWRPKAAGAWERIVASDSQWMDRVEAYLTDLSAQTPGALVERKTTSVAWHYRMVNPSLAARQLAGVKRDLARLLGDAPVEMIEGHMVMELRPRGASKGLVVLRILSQAKPPGTLVVIGDDRTDEEMFAALPASAIGIHVGDGDTRAAYRLADPAAVRRFLRGLLSARARPGQPECA